MQHIMHKQQKQSFQYLMYVAMLYVTVILISNVIASKVIHIDIFELPAGVIVYPLIFILDDVLAEVYGYKHTRPIIWFALLCSVIQLIIFQISIVIPAISEWQHQTAYHEILGAIPRITIAGFVAIACAQFINAYLIAKLKLKMQGQYMAVRLVASTFAAVTVDSIIFILGAFYGVLSGKTIIIMIVSQIFVKVSYEILLLPLISAAIGWLKRKEDIEYFDTNTNFNPFSRR